ncbi:unnamed protein product [Parajaminaea phylloscopi]
MATNIWIAASEGNLEAVKRFLEDEPNLTPVSPDSNTYTPLHAAASYGHVDLLRFLLTHPRAPPNAANTVDEDGDTPLFVVEDISTAKVLIDEFGADPRAVNEEGNTAARAAWESGWTEASDYLRSLTGEEPFQDEDEAALAELGEEAEDEQAVDDEKHDGTHTKALVTALEEFGTCEISDALIKLNHPTGGHLPGIDLISPRLADGKEVASHKVCGQVFPVEMVATSNASAPKPETHFVDAAPQDSIMLITAPSNSRNAIWGGLMTARAQARGVKAVVLDGRCRDLAEHWDAKMTVFAKGHSTLGQSPFTRPSKLGEAIIVGASPSSSSPSSDDPEEEDNNPTFPSLTVHPTDILLADVDGVVVVPRDQVLEAVGLAKKGREVDAKCMADLKKGRTVQETFKEHRGK